MREHFTAIAEATDRKILIYNIPYRTSVNLTNETLLRLAELPNIVGVKDSSGSIGAITRSLLAIRPAGFSVLTARTRCSFRCCAAARTAEYWRRPTLQPAGSSTSPGMSRPTTTWVARALWQPLQQFIPKLFQEANPMPIKHCLVASGIDRLSECRLPLTPVSPELGGVLDHLLADLA